MRRQKWGILTLLSMCFCLMFGTTAFAGNDGKRPTTLSRVGAASRTVTVGSDFELKVITNGDDDYLNWSITGNSGIIALNDDDRHDDEVEFIAKKKGTTQVTCKIAGTNVKVVFNIAVNDSTKTNRPTTITASGSRSKTVQIGSDFELKVKANGDKSKLCWSITGNRGIIAFNDDDRHDDDIDFKALRKGTTQVTCKIAGTNTKVVFNITVTEKIPTTISRVGAASRTVKVGDRFELAVTANGDDDRLCWTIISTGGIIAFDDDDRHDDDIDFIARKAGRATVACKIAGTNKTVNFIVNVK